MKIALIRRGYSATGGAEAYLRRFADGAVAAGHECILYGTAAWPRNEWPYNFRKVRHGRTPLDFAMELAASDLRKDADVVFSLERVLGCDAYRAGDGVHAAWLKRRAEFENPLKTWWRNRRDKHHELLKLEETMFKGEAARCVIANSKMVKDEILRDFGYPADRIHVIYNGVPPALSPQESADARDQIRRQLGYDQGDYLVLFAGSGWERKGLKFAIEAMNQTALGKPTLLVAGSGRKRSMPSSTRTRYIGSIKGLSRHLAAADAFVLPTLYDPFSNACLEALAAGIPVITTKANGFAEILEPGIDGEVMETPANTLTLAGAIERWADPELRAAARAKCREKGAIYSMERNARETLAVLEKVKEPRREITDSRSGISD